MTSFKDRIVDIIMQKVTDAGMYEVEGTSPESAEEAATELLSLFQQEVMAALPEKIKLDTSVYQNEGDGYASERIGYKHGYNDALKDMESRLKERLKQ